LHEFKENGHLEMAEKMGCEIPLPEYDVWHTNDFNFHKY